MIKLRQNAEKLGKAAQAARLAQIQAAAATRKFEAAREESRAAKRAYKAAKKATRKAKRAARKARKAADRAAARVTALRGEMAQAEKKRAKRVPRSAKGLVAARAIHASPPRSRPVEPAPVVPDLGAAAALVPADSISKN